MDPYIGEIRLFAGYYAPRGWALCDGTMMQVLENPALFSIIGAMYGGDGRTTFQLPDMRGRAPMHQGAGAGLTPRTIGKSGGTTTVTLMESQMPAHSHTPNAQSIADTENPAGAVWATTPKAGRAPGPSAYSSTPIESMNPLAFSVSGGSQPHNNMQPYTELNFIIALEGVYPPKS